MLFFTCVALFSSCSKELSNESDASQMINDATGTLKDSSGNCMSIIQGGTYYNGVTIAGDTNYVKIYIDVRAKGNFNIQTNKHNGFQFSETGVFADTGIQILNLKASGKPAEIMPTDFTIMFDGESCSFTINVIDSAARNPRNNNIDTAGIDLNKWQFFADNKFYSGNINTAVITNAYANALGRNLIMTGPVASGNPDTAFGMSIQFPGHDPVSGTYYTSDPGTGFLLHKEPNYDVIFAANSVNFPPILTISVTSFNKNTSTVSGVFFGKTHNYFGDSVAITNGKFQAQIQ
jgi:hypothetical protein